MITLRNEGALQPSPQLRGVAQDVSATLQGWPEMRSFTHWQLGDPTRVDGAEFHVEGGGELGHIHLNGEMHLALTRALRDELVRRNLAEPFVYDRAWVTVPIGSPEQAERALWLFRLGYDRLRSTSDADLFARIEARTASGSAGA